METLLLISSEEREFAGLVRHASEVARLEWPVDSARVATHFGNRWLLLANGPGPKLAAQAAEEALQREKVTAIVSAGFCGGLDPSLRVGDLVTASQVIDVDSGVRFPARPVQVGAFPTAGWLSRRGQGSGLAGLRIVQLACSDRVISTACEKRALRERTGAAAVDMESAALAGVAQRSGLPFHVVRVVSDTADQTFENDYNAARDASGRFSKFAVVCRALRHPFRRLPELFRLARTGRRAASVLGDTLAACRF